MKRLIILMFFCLAILAFFSIGNADEGLTVIKQYVDGHTISISITEVSQAVQSNFPNSLPIVIQALKRGNPQQAIVLLEILKKTQVTCRDVDSTLSYLLQSSAWPVKAQTLQFIADKKCKSQAKQLRQLLINENEIRVKGITATTLGAIGNYSDGDLIESHLQCESNDLRCQLQKESAFMNLGRNYRRDILLNQINSRDETLQTLALQGFQDTSDKEIIRILENEKSGVPSLQLAREYTAERMKTNAATSKIEKEQILWDSLKKKNPILMEWSVEVLLAADDSVQTREKLKSIAIASMGKNSDDPENTPNFYLLKNLFDRGILKKDELQKYSNHMRPQ